LQVSMEQEELQQAGQLIEQHWTTVNSSEGGTCIYQPKEKNPKIDVGLLVVIRKSITDDEVSPWKLGIICWITGNRRNGTQLGIQYLQGDIQAVQLQARKGNKIDTRFQTALLLSGKKVEGLSTPTLLTAPGLYVDSRPMLLRIGEVEQFIHARMKVTSSALVDRFFYQVADQHLRKINKEESSTTKEKNEQEKEKEKDTEVIDLSAMPTAHVEDFDADAKIAKDNIVTLDDMIVSKNK